MRVSKIQTQDPHAQESFDTMFKNHLNQKFKLMVKGPRINLYFTMPLHANAIGTCGVDDAKTPSYLTQ